jgi:hypothetical protein
MITTYLAQRLRGVGVYVDVRGKSENAAGALDEMAAHQLIYNRNPKRGPAQSIRL